MAEVIITVRGKPAPQGSKRHVGGGRMVEMSKAVGPWREAVRDETQKVAATRFTGPVEVHISFGLDRPRGHYRTGRSAHLLRPSAPELPAVRPDIDKLARAVLDGLKTGGAYKDDSQVVVLQLAKVYNEPGEVPGCTIVITEA